MSTRVFNGRKVNDKILQKMTSILNVIQQTDLHLMDEIKTKWNCKSVC